jgi:mRNA interferase RelE/StbE
MAYQVIFKPRARRELEKLSNAVAERIARAIDALALQPRPPGCKKLENEDNLWRIRVGDYRVVYQIHDDRLIVLVVRIGHRREVYD